MENINVSRENNIVNSTASRMIDELEKLQSKKDSLQEELKTSNAEIVEDIKLLRTKDNATMSTIHNIKTLLLDNNYDGIEVILEQRLKEGNWVYFYALLMKNVKNSQAIYNSLATVEKEYSNKLKDYNRYKDNYKFRLEKQNKIILK